MDLHRLGSGVISVAKPYLDAASVSEEVQRLVLIPLGVLAAAKDEAELATIWELGGEMLVECICSG